MAGTVVVFDFDKTIIDCDSDNWVVDGLGATQIFDDILRTNPWNSAMDKIMSVLDSRGELIEHIAQHLRKAPIHPSTVAAIKSAHALGCELRIVSDANHFFIETILKHHGLLNCFSEINTNPSHIDDKGRLRITPYHDTTKSPHGCSLCPSNMCKGLILERIRASMFVAGRKRIVYLGDGKGDYCPSLRLTEEDYVLPRRDYPLWELIRSNDKAVKAEVHGWSDGGEQGRILLEIIDKSAAVDTKPTSAEWRFQNGLLSSHEALPKALPVRH